MSGLLFVRDIGDDNWQWRSLSGDGHWDEYVHTGNTDALSESISQLNSAVCMLVPGHKAIVRNVPVEGSEKKHLAKLLPYELEDQVIDSVDDMHFCFGNIVDDRVNLIYLERDRLQESLDQFLSFGCDVQQIYPDFLILDHENTSAVFMLEGELVTAKFADGTGFSIEINVAPMVLEGLEFESEGARIKLAADSVESLADLKSCLPEKWFGEEGAEVEEQLANYWDLIDPHWGAPLNMRTGAFGRQLPVSRWWQMWKVPAYFAAASFVFALAVSYGDCMVAKSEGKGIRKQIEQVYLQAVPNGRRGDEEKRLKNMLKGGGAKSTEPTNLMVLLSGLANSMEKQADIKLSNFRYNGEQRELQVNIEVKGLNELGEFRNVLAANGVQSGSPRTSSRDQVYLANMKLSEKK